MAEKAKTDDGIGSMTTLTVALIIGGAVFTLTNGHHSCCCGARRSVRLEFEQRQAEMKAAAAAAETKSQTPSSDINDN
jgi:hypothetical protein